MRQRWLGIFLVMLGIGIAIGVASMVSAGAWDGYCGTDQNPVPCTQTETIPTVTGPTTAPEQPPVPTVPETVPTTTTAPTTPTTTLPADVPAVVKPATDCGTLTKNHAGRKWLKKFGCVLGAFRAGDVTCAELKKVGAGVIWLVKFNCNTKRAGRFQPPVTGSIE